MNQTMNSIIEYSGYPITTGSSVIGIKYNNGVVIAADTMGNYGNMHRYPNVQRLLKINENTVLGVSGDLADYQKVKSMVENRMLQEDLNDDGYKMTPLILHSWLTRILYQARCKMNPFWNTYIVGGVQDGLKYLGYVDKIGIAFTGNTLACGFGLHIAQVLCTYIVLPILRNFYESKQGNIIKEEAVSVVKKCIEVLYCMDKQSSDQFQIAIVDNTEGSSVSDVAKVESNWDIADYV
ncbi:Proteasome subunit beta type-4, partial [Intoshia linei]